MIGHGVANQLDAAQHRHFGRGLCGMMRMRELASLFVEPMRSE